VNVAILIPTIGPRDHSDGPESAALTLVEYGDFECPQCGQAFSIIKRVQAALEGRLRFVFRHFPLTSAHPHAQRAAETAEWAASQGAFWPMHDRLFENQDALGEQDLLAHAELLGLDPAGLSRAWAAHTFIPRIKEDFLGGIRAGVKGTPGFFVNGVLHEGRWHADDLLAALDPGSTVGL
jgi:protein-disulfide isomerase